MLVTQFIIHSLIQVLIGLSEEPSFKDTDCPAFYVRDDELVSSLLKRVGKSIKSWGESHDVAVSDSVSFGLPLNNYNQFDFIMIVF